MKTLLKNLLKALILVALLIHLIAYGALHSAAVNRYWLDRLEQWIPELNVTPVSGNLIEGLRFNLEYRNSATRVRLTDAELNIVPSCLWRLTICVKRVSARALEIATSASQRAPVDADKPVRLAAVELPLPLSVSQLRLQSLTIIHAQQERLSLRDLTLKGRWQGHRIGVTQAAFDHLWCRGGRLRGEIQLREFYPLRARLDCDTQSPLGGIAATLGGDLEKLVIGLETRGTWSVGGDLAVSTLAPQLPLAANLKLRKAVTLGDRQWQLQNAELGLKGRLQALETDLDVRFTSPFWAGDNDLQLQGRLNWSNSFDRIEMQLQTLRGTVLQSPLSGRGNIVWQQQRLIVQDLQLHQGANSLHASGGLSADAGSAVEALLEFPDTQQLWPPLQGALSGRVTLRGDPRRPDIDARLEARDFQYRQGVDRDIRFAFGEILLRLEQLGQQRSELDFDVKKLALQTRPMGDLMGSASGTAATHQVRINWHHPQGYNSRISCRGELAAGIWRGQCPSFSSQFAGRSWRLRESIGLGYDSVKQVAKVEPFCFESDAIALCSHSAVVVAENAVKGLSMSGSNLPWKLFSEWLPDSIEPRGTWGFTLLGGIVDGRPVGDARIGSLDTRLDWRSGQRRPSIALSRLEGSLHLEKQRAVLNWLGDAGDYGRASGDLKLEQDVVKAAFDIENTQLSLLEPFIKASPVQSLSGLINAKVSLKGALDQPQLNGSLEVTQARAELEDLPQPFENIEMKVQFDDRAAELEGHFNIASAPGTLKGNLSRNGQDWGGELFFDAERLQLRPDANSEITLSPSLKLSLTPREMQLGGKVEVPSARIKLKQLPAQALSPSPDTVILGRERESTRGPELVSNITVNLGDDVVFRGFGLDTKLTGHLAVRQSAVEGLRAKGVVRLRQGRYRAYGQALAIQHGDLIFVGDIDNPQLRVEAVREMDSDTIVVGLRATGPARNPTISLFSQPEMAQQAKLHYLLTGQPPGVTVSQDSNYLAAQAALSLGLNTSDTVIDKTARALGIDNFRVTTESGDAGPTMQLSGYLSPKVLVRYGFGVFDAANSLTLRYKVGRNLYIEAASGQFNSLDILWFFEPREASAE